MFNVGEKVRLTTVLHTEFSGMTGTVKKIIKSRNLVTVLCDNGERYDAKPENVELLESELKS